MNILRRSRGINSAQSGVESSPDYKHMEGKEDWAGLWRLDYNDMRWNRPRHYYKRSALSERVEQYTQMYHGPRIRPGLLREVENINTPLAVLRSHPDTPGILPHDREGIWVSTNPAWPERSIDIRLIGIHAVWADSSPECTEEFELTPDFIGAVHIDNSEPFDPTPRILAGLVVYVKPGPGDLE